MAIVQNHILLVTNYQVTSAPYSDVSNVFSILVELAKYANVNPTIPIIATSSNAIIFFKKKIYKLFER